MTFDVFYDLYEFSPGVYLPTGYIASLDRDGFLAHIQQRALPETIGSFGLALDPVRHELFTLVEQLQPKALEERFRPAKGKVRPLEELLSDKDTKGPVLSFIHRRLDSFLTLAARHRLPLTWQVERKVLVKDFLIGYAEEELQPLLSFRRTGEGVRYQLRLANGKGPWPVSSREVIPVTNHPAWLFVDHQLMRVAHINGNMVNPFREKDEVLIPAASVKTYFQRFILKVASTVDIEAEGFGLVHHDRLQGCRLMATRDFLTDRWLVAVRMVYPHAEFNWSDPKDKRTTLEFAEEVRIIQVRRDFSAERSYLERLPGLGLMRAEGNFFAVDAPDDDPLFILEWLAHNRSRLEAAGFAVAATEIEEQILCLFPPALEIGVAQGNDWFDIYGTVVVGAFSIPFLDLARYIRDDNRFFPLPNGEVFLIPREWMARYKTLFQFGRKDGKNLRLNKSQFTLLEETGLSVPARPEAVADDFQPSPALRANLRPYQLAGVRWLVELYRNQLGACLADDMGLGKTLQTIAVLLHAKEQKGALLEEGKADGPAQLSLFAAVPDADVLQPLNALIILPASLVYNWEEEIRKFAPSLTVYRHTTARRHRDNRLLARFDVVLTTYQTALRDADLLGEMEFEYIVLDESQQIKNRESKIFKAINTFNGRHKISLSGTPIENSLSDLWSQMQFINPDLLGSFTFFRREFINPIEKYRNEEKKARLRSLVAPYLLRRTKEQVAQDLPPLTTQLFYSEMAVEQRRLYEREKSAARNYLLENFDAKSPQYRILVLQSLTKLRQLANHPRLFREPFERESGKFSDVLENWEVIRKSGHKVLFFSSFVQYLSLFREAFEERGQPYAWLTGELTAAERQVQIRRFEEDPETQVFLISIKAGGTGLNLTAADYVYILDPWWNPTTEQQAIARAHRIGQDKHVIATKFITRDSIEEKILLLQERKAQLAEDILDNVGKTDFNRSDIEFLFE